MALGKPNVLSVKEVVFAKPPERESMKMTILS
jgi:hypothetical protein